MFISFYIDSKFQVKIYKQPNHHVNILSTTAPPTMRPTPPHKPPYHSWSASQTPPCTNRRLSPPCTRRSTRCARQIPCKCCSKRWRPAIKRATSDSISNDADTKTIKQSRTVVTSTHLQRRTLGSDFREAHNVAKVNGHRFVVLGGHL